jgi:hypothetical protein
MLTLLREYKQRISELSYAGEDTRWRDRLCPYSPTGDYLCFSKTPSKFPLDSRGVPVVTRNGESYYNPVTLAQFALKLHGLGEEKRFLNVARVLLESQGANGALGYPFAYSHYLCPTRPFPVGWVSGMAQGQALSVFARAYVLSGDTAFLQAGERAFEVLQRLTSEGGCRTDAGRLDSALSNFIFFEEYPTEPQSYTLNGFLFAIIGIYDWSWLNSFVGGKSCAAEDCFRSCVNTVGVLLPYFDINGFSVYDLGYITFKSNKKFSFKYHACHVMQLHALNSLVENDVLKHYESKWTCALTKRNYAGYAYSLLRKSRKLLFS